MNSLFRTLAAAIAGLALVSISPDASASFHLWQVDQLYSDASGNVQYLEFFTAFSGQEFLTNSNFFGGLQASQGGNIHTFLFPANLPATLDHTTQNQKFLIATQGFADLNIVTPDYIVPNGFLFMPGGTITVEGGGDSLTYAALGANGQKALDRLGNVVATTPTNFAGATGCVSIPPPTPAGVYDIDGNGVVEALTDGVLLLRYMFGLRGSALIDSAIGPCATRSTADAIQTFISTQLPPP